LFLSPPAFLRINAGGMVFPEFPKYRFKHRFMRGTDGFTGAGSTEVMAGTGFARMAPTAGR